MRLYGRYNINSAVLISALSVDNGTVIVSPNG